MNTPTPAKKYLANPYIAKPVDLAAPQSINRDKMARAVGAEVELFGCRCKVTHVNPGKRRITLTLL